MRVIELQSCPRDSSPPPFLRKKEKQKEKEEEEEKKKDTDSCNNEKETVDIEREVHVQQWWSALVDRYVDENKPDPLVVQQMKRWSFEWIDDEEEEEENNDHVANAVPSETESQLNWMNDESWIATAEIAQSVTAKSDADADADADAAAVDSPPPSPCPSYRLSGKLKWKHEHLIVTLAAQCVFRGSMSMNSSTAQPLQPQQSMTLIVHASASFAKSPQQPQPQQQCKIIERLRNDDYVSKLLHGPPQLLCQAEIILSSKGGEQEQRFHTDESVAEAIRRAIWSTADDALDVIAFVVQQALLPVLPSASSSSSPLCWSQHPRIIAAITPNTNIITTKAPCSTPTFGAATSSILIMTPPQRMRILAAASPLADRIRLGLLEDALVDACEREAAIEQVQSLEIQMDAAAEDTHHENHINDDDHDDDDDDTTTTTTITTTTTTSPSRKRNKSRNSNKRCKR